MVNFRDMTRNMMAREKALYEGHAVAAVAAMSEAIAAQALKLIEVEYEVLPHVMDVAQAMEPDAPLLHDNMYTIGVEPKPAKPSNVAKRVEFASRGCRGRLRQGGRRRRARVHHRSRCTKATSSRTRAWRACPRTARRSCGARRRDSSSCAASARSSSAWMLVEAARDRLRDRRRLRRQDRRLPRAARARAVAQGGPAGEDGDVAHRGLPGDRSDLRREGLGQDRRDARRADHRGRGAAQVPGRRVPGLAGAARLHVRVRAVRSRERACDRLRRGREPAEGRGVPRAGRTDRGVRRREVIDELAKRLHSIRSSSG